MATHDTTCPLDCPDACSLTVDVDTTGRLERIDGSHENQLTAGFICGKVRNIAEHVYSPERIRTPLLRTGSKEAPRFREASWDEALDLVASRFGEICARHGGSAILPMNYGGSNGFLSDGLADERWFRRMGASRLHRSVCAVPTGLAAEALYGKMPGVAFDDYVHAKLIVVWGANPEASSIHHVPLILEAVKQGAKLVVVDPRQTGLAKRADLHLQLRPGTDAALALAVAHLLFQTGGADEAFLDEHVVGTSEYRKLASQWEAQRAAEETGIPKAAIETFAQWYGALSPAVVRCGWGLERNRNGGAAAAAVMALPAIGGKFGVRGGGYTMSNSPAWNSDVEDLINEPIPDSRTLNMLRLGEDLLNLSDPQIMGLFIYNCNPLTAIPAQEKVREGLQRQDLFTVAFDAVMTDSARMADVVLPATTFLEHRDLVSAYGAYYAREVAPVIKPVGEARSNHSVFIELLNRMDLVRDDDRQDEEELLSAIAKQLGPTSSEGSLRGPGRNSPVGAHPVQFQDVWPNTKDRKIYLMSAEPSSENGLNLHKYTADPAPEKLALISPATAQRISSTFGQLESDLVPLEMHPSDATARGLKPGDLVEISNELASVVTTLEVTPEVGAGTVSLPKGLWSRNTRSGNTSNALCPDTESHLGRAACFNDARVEVKRASADSGKPAQKV